jgi:endonuclease/exonuclease/phosphatase family metal-dependent hydrolase
LSNKKRLLIGIILFVILILILVFLFNASRVGSLEACLVDCSISSPLFSNEVKIMNLNMLHGHPDFEYLSNRIDLLVEQIINLSPDIITLQEVPWTTTTRSTAKYLAERTGMNYIYLPANGNRWAIFFAEGEAILSKYPLKEVEFRELFPQAGFFEHRVALKATALTPFGEIQIVTTHLTNGDPNINQNQAIDLYNFVSDIDNGVVIVSGDFNAREESPQISFLSDSWIDTYRDSNPSGRGLTCCAELLSGLDIDSKMEKRIDYLFLVPDEDLDNKIVDSILVLDHPFGIDNEQLWISDHIGILTTIEISPQYGK